jgi:menaquinone-dependent protoporphyrinogen oxidase
LRVLVSAASKHGSTAEIARSIAEALARRGLVVTVIAPDQQPDTADYDAIVVGSAVYTGHWLKSARVMAAALSDRPSDQRLWLFSSGPVGRPPRPATGAVNIADLLARTRPAGHQLFTGRIDSSVLSFGERAIVAALRVPVGDYRDWSAIQAWADEIADALLEGSSERASADVAIG